MGTPAFPEPYQPERDPVQLQQGAVFLSSVRHPPPGSWTDNRLEQANHLRGLIYLAISAVRNAMASAPAWCERRQRRDRTTFGAGAVSVVKALSGAGGSGNDEDYSPVHDHPVSRILECPNPNDTFGSLLSYGTMQWALTGNGPFWFVPGKNGERPVELYPLVEALLQVNSAPSLQYPEGSWRVTPYYPNGTGWAYGGLANRLAYSAILPGQEVRKLQEPHPLTRSDGYSPLTACGAQFDIMEAIDKSRHAAFMHGTRVGTLVQLPPGMSQEAIDAVGEAVKQKYAGPDNAGKTMVVSGTPDGKNGLDVKQLNESPREMDYVQSWEQAVKFVLAAFGTPPSITGLNPSTGYAEFYAAQTQFHYRLSQLAKQWSDFFTRTLAWPWSKKRGEYRVRIEVPEPRNKEQQQQYMLAMGQAGNVSVNEQRAFINMKPVRFGDLPSQLYVQKVQELEFPQPIAPTGPDSAPLPEGSGGDDLPPDATQDGEPADDQGDDTQGAVTAAALSSLGVSAGGQDDETVQKAWDEQKHKRDRGKFSRTQGSAAKQAIAAHLGLSGRRQTRPQGASPAAPPANPQANHDALARRLLGGRPNVVLRIAGAAAGQMQHHRITDGASLKRYLDAGGVLPKATYAEAAKQVPVATPQAQQTIATAKQWAVTQADKHADRVAAHFGISRERAHALLAHAIQATAEHAAKNGGAMPNVTIRNKKTGQSAKLAPKGKAGPTAGAPPKPKNPSGKGSLPTRPGTVAKSLDSTEGDTGNEPMDDVRPEFRELLARLAG